MIKDGLLFSIIPEMSERIEKLLTDGLSEGYAGTKDEDRIQRAGFSGKANDYLSPDGDGGHYHDEYFAKDYGGGQELAQEGNELGTRVYAGGVIPIEELQKIGLTTNDVIARLITSVNTLRGKTRLGEPCSLDLPDGWGYQYEVLKKSKEVPLTIGYESITYKGREVFAHGHMISPIN